MAANMVSLVLLETSGNQAYVYATNRMAENVGASALIQKCCTEWLLESVAQCTGKASLYSPEPDRLRSTLCDARLNPPIESGGQVEVVEAISGKALLLARTPEIGRSIIADVTRQAIIDAPGLDVKGVLREFAWDQQGIGDALQAAYQEYEVLRASRLGPEMRFLRLPVIAECSSSGLPASYISCEEKDRGKPMSAQVHTKRLRNPDESRTPSVSADGVEYELSRELDKSQWVGVVHADGNGLGEVFLHFEDYCSSSGSPSEKNRNYVDTVRRFSCSVDVCTHKAFANAVALIAEPALRSKNGPKPEPIALRPLVLGGDDLTVECDGKLALQFAADYLQEFETATAADPTTAEVARRMTLDKLPMPWLSACAGVAIVKSHYPFFEAYDLAKELMALAKDESKARMSISNDGHVWRVPCSALEFHVVHDSSTVDVADIRTRLTIISDARRGKEEDAAEEIHLFGGPYVVSDPQNLPQEVARTALEWTQKHAWSRLKDSVAVLREKDGEGHRRLPSSQAHELRASLFEGKKTADRVLGLMYDRYDILPRLCLSDKSLFSPEVVPPHDQDKERVVMITQYLDAIESMDFFTEPKEDTNGSNTGEVRDDGNR